MKPRQLTDRVREWLRGSRRRRMGAIGLGLAVIAAAIGLPLYFAVFADDGGGPAVSPTPGPEVSACARPTLIEPPTTIPSDDWQDLTLPSVDDCFSIVASNADAGGVALDSAFVLEAREPVDIASLADRLQVEPDLELDIEPVSDDEVSVRPAALSAAAARYRIQPQEALSEDTVYRFTILDKPDGLPMRTWAFQAQRPLRVVQTLPADESTEVPLNIGIELTFSHEGVTGVQESFQITPPVQGRFETHKRTTVFVPEGLQPQTLYSVTLGADIGIEGSDQTMGEAFIFRFETGSEERAGETPGGPPSLQFSRRVWESATSEAPVLALFSISPESDSLPNTPLPFTVYRFPDVDAFVASLDQFTAIPDWARVSRSRFTADTSGLQAVASFEATLESIGESGDLFVRFPDPLPQDYYLVETSFEGRPVQAWLQITDVATYVSVSRGRTLVWANDVVAKAPLADASVRALGTDFSTTTGPDGVAFFETPDDLIRLQTSPFGYTTTETVGNLIVTAADGRSAVVPLADIFTGFRFFGFREFPFSGDPGLYWRFLYTDRRLYRPTDTVHFWGLVRQRESPPPSQEITVEVSTDYAETGEYQPVVAARTTVTTTATGTFIGELDLEGVSPGFYYLRTRVGDQVISTEYIEVEDFIKPAYKIDVTPSSAAVFAGEEMEFTVEASFFDGSPVPNVTLDYSGDASGTLTTDAAGRAVVPFTATGEPLDYTWEVLNVTPTLAEEGEITGSGRVRVFPAALTLDIESEFSEGTATVSGTVYDVDLDRINDDEARDLSDYRGDPSPGRTVTAQVVEQSYQRIEVGETYDFVAKAVRKGYEYEPVTTPLGEFTPTSDAQGRFSFSFPAQEGNSYEVTFTVADDAARVLSTETWVYAGTPFSPFGDLPYLALASEDPYAVGDEVAATMRQGDQDLPAGGDNRYLFYLAQNGILDYSIQDGPRFSFPFAEEHIPNVNIIAVRFTGTTHQEIGFSQSAPFDQSLRQLTVSVQPDQDRYRPGDEATLDITVTDNEDRPVQAEVALSAVDEAIFRLQGETFFADLDILESLFVPVSSGVFRTYASHQYPSLSGGGAEKGGGDGERDNFKDIALFDRVTTDSGGHASISFDLPDNLTSWRVTALAVTDDLYAGSSVSLVPVSLPMFVDVAMNTSYLSSDRPAIRVRAFGEALTAADQASFEVTSPTLLDEPLTASGAAFTPVDIALPPLREGQHELTVRASAGDLEDALVRTVTVTPSRLLRSDARFYELEPGQDLVPEGSADHLTRVLITDHNRGRYYPVLRSLSWTYGDRVDQMLARNLAQDLLGQYFEEEATFPAEFHPSIYQTLDGGIAIFPFADDDLVLSARLAAVAPDRFGRQALARYFLAVTGNADETRERVIIALYGLAALGETVLPDVQALAALGDLTPRERLFLALAAAELGDQDTAYNLYRGLLDEFAQQRGSSVRLNVGVDQDDILEATSLAAVLAASVGDDFASLLFDYTTNNYTEDTLIYLEQISYLAEALPNLSAAPVHFAYTLDGQRTEEELERGKSLALLLTPEDLGGLNLEAIDGTLGVASSFLAPFDPASVQPDPALSITRTYEGQPTDAATIEEGDLVRISIAYMLGEQAVDGCYQVSDLLPSGLQSVTRLHEWDVGDTEATYPYAIEGQRVSFCLYKDDEQEPIVYYARVAGTGTYTAEPAVIQSQKAPESINITGALPVEIR